MANYKHTCLCLRLALRLVITWSCLCLALCVVAYLYHYSHVVRGCVCTHALTCIRHMRGWRNHIEIVLFEISNWMKPYPSVFHTYASNLSPVKVFVGPTNLDEVSKRIPPTSPYNAYYVLRGTSSPGGSESHLCPRVMLIIQSYRCAITTSYQLLTKYCVLYNHYTILTSYYAIISLSYQSYNHTLPIPESLWKRHSFYASLGHPTRQQKMQSSPWFSILEADFPTCLLIRRNAFHRYP